MKKKGIIIGLCTALILSSTVFAVDLGSVINDALEATGSITTETVRFGDVDFQVPTFYVKDETSTDVQLKYHAKDQKVDLTFYLGDYTNSSEEFENTKLDIVNNIVSGMPDGKLLKTEDSKLIGFDGIRFDFSSTVITDISYLLNLLAFWLANLIFSSRGKSLFEKSAALKPRCSLFIFAMKSVSAFESFKP